MACHRRHHRQHHGGIEEADLPAAPQVGVVAAFVDVVEAEQIGEEAAVELRRFEKPRDVLVAAGLQDVVERRFGMTPAAGMLRRRPGLQIGDQMHLTSGHRGRNFHLQSSISRFHYGQQNKGFAAVFACVRTITVDLCRGEIPRRLDRGPPRLRSGQAPSRAERPSLHDKRLIVERRSLHSALRAPVETTEIAICDSPPIRRPSAPRRASRDAVACSAPDGRAASCPRIPYGTILAPPGSARPGRRISRRAAAHRDS